jgi:hypothetical protein
MVTRLDPVVRTGVPACARAPREAGQEKGAAGKARRAFSGSFQL